MRSSTIFHVHSFAFNRNAMLSYFYSWYSCDRCIAQFRVHRIWRNDDNLKWQRFIAFDAMTTSWFFEIRARTSYWKLLKYFCQCLNIATLISKYWSYVFSLQWARLVFWKAWTIIRSKTAISTRNRQKNKIEIMRRRHLDTTNFRDFESEKSALLQKHRKSSKRCDFRLSRFRWLFETHALVKRSIQQAIEYRWFIEHKRTANALALQMIDQLAQRYDNSFAHESIETSIVYIAMLTSWIEIDSLTSSW